jgi:acyl-CoA dehydrogenase
MDLTISEEHRQIAEMVRNFIKKEVAPYEMEIEEKDEIPKHIVDQMKELGFFGMTVPVEYGGSGLGLLPFSLVSIELGRTHPAIWQFLSVNNGTGWHGIHYFGSEAQKKKYLPKVATGQYIAAFALTEPNAGSDASSIKTSAVRAGDSYVLNGTKCFITNGPVADFVTVMAVTDKKRRAKGGITAFIVDKGTPGFTVGQVDRKMGHRGTYTSELIFDNCVVPAENIVGDLGMGFKVAMKTLDATRLTVLATAVGTAERLLELSADYAKMRVQFGKPIAANQAIQWMLADMATEIYAARSMLFHAAWKGDQGQKFSTEAAMFKLFASEMACRCADKALQIHGGMGYMKDLVIERIYRDVRLLTIGDGTSEIQRMVIARSVLQD